MTMLKLKLDAETQLPILDDDQRILYVDDDGKELPLDPPAMYDKITALGKESQGHREKYNGIVEKFKMFDSIEDIVEWKTKADEALKTVENFNEKDWLKADKVETLKKDMAESYEEKLKNKDKGFADKEKEYKAEIEKHQQQIRTLLVSNKFAASKYFNGEKPVTLLEPEIAESYFGKYVRVEVDNDGNPITRLYYPNGDAVLSKLNPGEPAEFEEGIGLIIDNYPKKEKILRSSSNTGSGSSGGSGGSEGDDNLTSLKKQLAAAQEAGDFTSSISIKNKIIDLQRKTA